MPSKSQHMHSLAPKHTFHFVPARPSEPSAFQLTPRGRGLGHNVVGVLTSEVLRKPSSRLAAPKTSPWALALLEAKLPSASNLLLSSVFHFPVSQPRPRLDCILLYRTR